MKFWEAMKALEEGKKVTQKELRSYYCNQDGKLCKIWRNSGEKATEAYLNLDTALNSDWEIYDDNNHMIEEAMQETCEYKRVRKTRWSKK